MSKMTHLHVHSSYSMLDGLSSPKEIAGCAKRLDFNSIAITDHGSCAGLYRFQSCCLDEFNIKPILGCEMYITDDLTVKEKETSMYHLVLIAKNEIGYKNLIYLSSYGNLYGFYKKPRIDFNILKVHSNGLIVSTACCIGELPSLLWSGKEKEADELVQKYKGVFKDDYYIEIMLHKYFKDKSQEEREKKLAKMLYDTAKRNDVKSICTCDAHYASKDLWQAHDILLSIQTLNNIKNPERLSFDSDDFYIKSEQEMENLYSGYPELLKNTLEIEEKIEKKIIKSSTDLFPDFKLPPGFSSDEQYLKTLVVDGMKKKGLIKIQKYRDRIKYEMEVILKCKYTKYFLVLWDIINFANVNGIALGCGRGSAVSSLCLYVLNITKIDPLKYDLIFERFLNPERISPPDVDVDFDYFRRDEVYDYIVRKYGQDHCSQIGTYNAFKARAAIRSTAKALDLGNDWEKYQEAKRKNPKIKQSEFKNSLALADKISKLVPFAPNITIKESMEKEKEFRDMIEQYPRLLEYAQIIEGRLSAGGVHPAGIVISKCPIIDCIPMRNSKGVICSQFDGPEIEKIGLLKFDLLALKTLTVIDKTVKMIKERHGKVINVDDLEPNDQKVFEIFDGRNYKMDTKGVFQFESDGIYGLLKDMRVDEFEDLIAANALYRPGPMKAGVGKMYCDFKHGRKEIKYLHPKMGEVLKNTYGMMVYQENFMKVSQVLAGFTGGQADTLRKAVGKKKPELLKEQKGLFIEGCVKRGIDKEIAKKIFEQIDYFAGYGFNKSHSAAYAMIAYQTAYLKYYYPLEFFCNLLTSEIDNNDKNYKLNLYIKAAEKVGVKCWGPDINKSGLEFVINKVILKNGNEEEVLRFPLTGIKGIGEKAVKNIVEKQPYESFEDFMRKVDHRLVNIRVFNALVDNGCVDTFGISRKEIANKHTEMKIKIEKDKKEKKKQDEIMQRDGTETLFDFAGDNLKI